MQCTQCTLHTMKTISIVKVEIHGSFLMLMVHFTKIIVENRKMSKHFLEFFFSSFVWTFSREVLEN